jgi:hypothetical protein
MAQGVMALRIMFDYVREACSNVSAVNWMRVVEVLSFLLILYGVVHTWNLERKRRKRIRIARCAMAEGARIRQRYRIDPIQDLAPAERLVVDAEAHSWAEKTTVALQSFSPEASLSFEYVGPETNPEEFKLVERLETLRRLMENLDAFL